jgi:hypothetical protein
MPDAMLALPGPAAAAPTLRDAPSRSLLAPDAEARIFDSCDLNHQNATL